MKRLCARDSKHVLGSQISPLDGVCEECRKQDRFLLVRTSEPDYALALSKLRSIPFNPNPKVLHTIMLPVIGWIESTLIRKGTSAPDAPFKGPHSLIHACEWMLSVASKEQLGATHHSYLTSNIMDIVRDLGYVSLQGVLKGLASVDKPRRAVLRILNGLVYFWADACPVGRVALTSSIQNWAVGPELRPAIFSPEEIEYFDKSSLTEVPFRTNPSSRQILQSIIPLYWSNLNMSEFWYTLQRAKMSNLETTQCSECNATSQYDTSTGVRACGHVNLDVSPVVLSRPTAHGIEWRTHRGALLGTADDGFGAKEVSEAKARSESLEKEMLNQLLKTKKTGPSDKKLPLITLSPAEQGLMTISVKPFKAEFVQAILAGNLPATDRKWNGDKQLWTVRMSHFDAVSALIIQHYGPYDVTASETPFPPPLCLA